MSSHRAEATLKVRLAAPFISHLLSVLANCAIFDLYPPTEILNHWENISGSPDPSFPSNTQETFFELHEYPVHR
ncbi:uncharacterized protein P174DRAFT_439598 [Aspergillus novofumigatus IBT 16806]|uniref:Uncharacterized protein n=1 Tax=Aspergillus novofumigatus (strain IBT 16806) TaxID=1392255 RepID=A0A2I1CBA5_ASPN1|nr:uncharacterized protein P174DRAFT_439598 [Aspergillus novofumigatus IBT 16806]PKX94917.1 hypothetical protein P174DRAFT_439598 [Aspergillus novofumigatus IBT 16806]